MHRSRPAWLNDRISKAFTLESSPHFEGHKEVSSDEYLTSRATNTLFFFTFSSFD